MARGLSRELSQQKKTKEQAKGNKGNQEGLNATQRAERDAKMMQEKAARKAAERDEKNKQGGDAAAQVAAEEARKKVQRDAKKERLAMRKSQPLRSDFGRSCCSRLLATSALKASLCRSQIFPIFSGPASPGQFFMISNDHKFRKL